MKKDKEIIKEFILKNIWDKKTKIFLFWSRVSWNNRKNSDYDIGILWEEKIGFQRLLRLKRKLKELPYLIDLVDFQDVDEEFKTIALQNIEPWN